MLDKTADFERLLRKMLVCVVLTDNLQHEYASLTLKDALALVDARVLDHLLMGSKITSFVERGILHILYRFPDDHSIKSQHSPRYLAEFCYRFNRRFQLDSMLPRFVYVAVRTPPMPNRLLKMVESYG